MKNTHKYPEFIARFYDVIYDRIRSDTDYDYYMKKILNCKGPILEIGVGTGRFFVEARKRGADIYGVDISDEMTKILTGKLDKNDHFRIKVQDMVKLDLEKNFELIIAPFRVFSHMITTREQINMLNRVNDHLLPGGNFIFDLFIPDPQIMKQGINSVVDFEGEYEKGRKLKRIVSAKANLINQVNKVEMKIIWDENGVEKSEKWNFTMRYFFYHELKHLIARSDLELVNIYGDYYENKPGEKSKDFIVVCKQQKLQE